MLTYEDPAFRKFKIETDNEYFYSSSSSSVSLSKFRSKIFKASSTDISPNFT